MDAQTSTRLQIANDDELVFEFFSTFSRIECELKKNGFVKPGPYKSAQADWDTFADEMNPKLHNSESRRFSSAKAFLLEEPPRKQVVSYPGRMVCAENARQENETEARYLFRLVRDVRNNLFHGGKYPDGEYLDEQALRDATLLKSCLAVLHECVPVHPRTSAFRGERR